MDRTLRYKVQDIPPVPVLLSSALQLVLIGITTVLTISSVIAGFVCAPLDDPVRARLFCTSLFTVGMATALNSVFGIRLPIFQGASGTFIPPLLAMRSAGIWTCPTRLIPLNVSVLDYNGTELDDRNTTISYSTDYNRIAELQGSLMAASVFEILIGATGLVGFLLKFISPITISVTITLTALSLYRIPVDYCRSSWLISALFIAFKVHKPLLKMTFAKKLRFLFGTQWILTWSGEENKGVIILVIQSLYLSRINIPIPEIRQNGCGLKRKRFPVFQFFSILFSILIVWSVCAVFTYTGLLSDNPANVGYRARTDIKTNILSSTPWFILPYPGQFGTPSFNSAIFLGFVVAVFSSILESVGDYFAASRVCKTGHPPNHAINRGILIEGIVSIVCGAMGTGHATTSYGAVVGVIGITKIASRWVFVVAGILCMIMAVIGKFGAVLALVPDPAIGAVIFVMLGLLTSMGIAALKEVDLSSTRNMSVLGISLYVGIVIPHWLQLYPGELKTGNIQADQVLNVILGTPMILGIITSMILDNTVKGSSTEANTLNEDDTECQELNVRTEAAQIINAEMPTVNSNIYDFPGITKFQQNFKCLRYIPFLHRYEFTSSDSI